MIEFYSENNFELSDKDKVQTWLERVIEREDKKTGELTYVFCNDQQLLKLNKEFLNHDTLTDIITFDYSLGNEIHGEIYISTDRVEENAEEFEVSFMNELSRVMVHGILHLCGYKDKSEEEKNQMRNKENHYMAEAAHLSS